MAASTAKKPNLPWKTRLQTAAIGHILDWCCNPDGTVNRRLLSLFEFPKIPPSLFPIDNVTSRDITYDPSHSLWFRLYTPLLSPTPASQLPVVVYFHGGGFFCARPDMKIIDSHCRRLAACLHAVVVSVRYRQAPEHKLPAQFEDGMRVLRHLDGSGEGFGDVGRCFLVGDSCGGNIAHHVAVMAAKEGRFERLRVAGVVVVQPFLGGEECTVSELEINAAGITADRIAVWWKVALPEGSNRDHEAVNIFGPKSTVDIRSLNFPPVIVFIGGFDPLKDWQMRYYNGMKNAGKEVCLIAYPNAIHGFALFHELPESSLFVADLQKFIQKH